MSSRFSITQAVVDGFRFTRRESRALTRMAVLPVGISFIIQVALSIEAADISPYAEFIYTLPSLIITARFMVQIARLRFLGERDDQLPTDPAYLAARRHSMHTAVLLWLVVNAAATVIVGYFEWLSDMTSANMPAAAVGTAPPTLTGALLIYNVLGLFLMLTAIWGLRFAVAHLVVAADFPLSVYLNRVRGFGMSLRLLGFSFMVAVPASLAFMGVVELLAPDGKMPQGVPLVIFLALNNIISYAALCVLVGGACHALVEILGDKGKKA